MLTYKQPTKIFLNRHLLKNKSRFFYIKSIQACDLPATIWSFKKIWRTKSLLKSKNRTGTIIYPWGNLRVFIYYYSLIIAFQLAKILWAVHVTNFYEILIVNPAKLFKLRTIGKNETFSKQSWRWVMEKSSDYNFSLSP